MRLSIIAIALLACLATASAVRLSSHVRSRHATVSASPQKKKSALPWFLGGNKLNRVFEQYKLRPEVIAGPTAPAQWFTQILDHFDWQNNATWQQRYYVNQDHYQQGGPVFLTFGGEGPMDGGYVYNTMVNNYAEATGAIVFGVEHRYYGESAPVSDYSTPNMRYLSSQQALADLAHFHEEMVEKMQLTGPWIVFGGSYSGALSAWFRIKYPQLAIGAIATSGPVLAKVDFSEYLQVVAASLTTLGGSTCLAPIQTAIQQVQSMMTTPAGLQELQKTFNLCEPLNGDLDLQTLASTLVGSFMGVVQYNAEQAGTPTISTLCTMMTNSSQTALQNLVSVTNLINAADGSCINTSYKDMIAELSNTTAGPGQASRCWIYQTCQEFGYFQTTDAPNLPFGNMMNLNYSQAMCKDVFGIDRFPLVNDTNNWYGDDNPAGSDILFPNGSIDPWHALSVQADQPDNQNLLFINGTAHCANMIPPQPSDPPSLVAARKTILSTIQTMIADNKNTRKVRVH